jgi:hypothetical protein
VLLQVRMTTLHILVEGKGLHYLLAGHYFVMLLKFKAGSVKFKNCHDCFTLCDTFFKIAVLLPVQVLFAFRWQRISHVFA